jgi:hypothetical protein
MWISERIIPFHVFQDHCDERRFSYMGESGKYFVTCKLGPDHCNHHECPIWNNIKLVKDIDGNQLKTPENSLNSINLRLKNAEYNSNRPG